MAEEILTRHMLYPPLIPEMASAVLNNIANGSIELPEDHQASIFLALQIVRDQNMGAQHSKDRKRHDRKKGEQIRGRRNRN